MDTNSVEAGGLWAGPVRPSKKTGCQHSAPTFGCTGCIESQRMAWFKEKYEEVVKTHKPRPCARHGQTMKPYTHCEIEGRAVAVVGCQHVTKYGQFLCEDQDYTVPLE